MDCARNYRKDFAWRFSAAQGGENIIETEREVIGFIITCYLLMKIYCLFIEKKVKLMYHF